MCTCTCTSELWKNACFILACGSCKQAGWNRHSLHPNTTRTISIRVASFTKNMKQIISAYLDGYDLWCARGEGTTHLTWTKHKCLLHDKILPLQPPEQYRLCCFMSGLHENPHCTQLWSKAQSHRKTTAGYLKFSVQGPFPLLVQVVENWWKLSMRRVLNGETVRHSNCLRPKI